MVGIISVAVQGPSDPNNNGPELGFPDTNIYLLFLFFLCFQAYYVVWYLKASISFKLSFSYFTIASK